MTRRRRENSNREEICSLKSKTGRKKNFFPFFSHFSHSVWSSFTLVWIKLCSHMTGHLPSLLKVSHFSTSPSRTSACLKAKLPVRLPDVISSSSLPLSLSFLLSHLFHCFCVYSIYSYCLYTALDFTLLRARVASQGPIPLFPTCLYFLYILPHTHTRIQVCLQCILPLSRVWDCARGGNFFHVLVSFFMSCNGEYWMSRCVLLSFGSAQLVRRAGINSLWLYVVLVWINRSSRYLFKKEGTMLFVLATEGQPKWSSINNTCSTSEQSQAKAWARKVSKVLFVLWELA